MFIYEYKSRADNINDHAVECLRVLYDNAFPCGEGHGYDNIINKVKELIKTQGKDNLLTLTGKSGKTYNYPYDFYYNPQEWQLMVLENFMNSYAITRSWESNVDTMQDYILNEDGSHVIDVWKEDSDGRGHRGYDKFPPLKTAIKDIINKNIEIKSGDSEHTADEIIDKVSEYILNCKKFYQFGLQDENHFRGAVIFRSPTSKRETVIEAWKDVFDTDITIPDDSEWTDEYEYAERLENDELK